LPWYLLHNWAPINYVVLYVDITGEVVVERRKDREHTCDGLVPGHTYRVRVAVCSDGGRSEVRCVYALNFCSLYPFILVQLWNKLFGSRKSRSNL